MLAAIQQHKRLLIVLAALFLPVGIFLGAVQGFLLSSDVAGNIRLAVEEGMEKALGVPVRIQDVRVGVFGRLTFTGVAVGPKAQIRADEAVVHYSLVSYLWHRDDPVQAVTRIDLVRPVAEVTMDSEGRLDILRMFQQPVVTAGVTGPRYSIRLIDGSVILKSLDIARMDAAIWAAGGIKSSDTLEAVMARGYAPDGEPARYDGVRGVLGLTGGPDITLDLSGTLNLLGGRRIAISGVWGWHKDRAVYRLKVSGADLDATRLWELAAFPDQFGWAQGGTGRLDADLSLDESGAFDYTARYSLVNGLYTGPGPFGQASSMAGDIIVTPAAIEMEHLGFVYRGSHWTVGGKVYPGQIPVLNLAVNTSAADLAQVPRRLLGTFGIGWPEELSLEGKARVSVLVRGPADSPLFTGSLRPKKAAVLWKRAVLPLTDIEGEIVLDGQTAIAKGLTGRWGGSRVEISGEVNGAVDLTTARLALDVQARGIKGADLAALAGSAGELGRALRRSGLVASGEARVTGKPLDPEVSGSFAVLSGRVDPWDLKGFSGSFRYARNVVDITKAGWKLNGGDISGSGRISWRGPEPDYTFSLAGNKVPLSAFPQASDFGLEGVLSGTLAAKGRGWDADNLTLSARGAIDEAALLGQPFNELVAQVAMVDGRLSLDYLRADSAIGKFSAAGLFGQKTDLHLVVAVPRIASVLDALPELLAQAAKKRFWTAERGRLLLLGQVGNWGRELRALKPSGSLTLDGRLTSGGSAGDTAFRGLLDWKKAGLAGQELDRARASLRVDPVRLDVASLELMSGAITLRGAGGLDFASGKLGGVWLKTTGASVSRLLGLAGLAREAARLGLDGETDLVLRAGGSLAKASLTGEATLANGRFLGEKVSSARLRFKAPEINVAKGTDLSRVNWQIDDAVAAGPWGRFSASGVAGSSGVSLALHGENLSLKSAGSVLARLGRSASGDGPQSWLAAVDGTATLTGKITGTWLQPKFDGSVSVARPAFQDYRFDRLDGKFVFRDGLLEVPAASLGYGKAAYSISGQARLVEPRQPSRPAKPGQPAKVEQPASPGQPGTVVQAGGKYPSYDFRVDATGSPLADLAAAAGVKLPSGVQGVVSGSARVWGVGTDVSVRLTAEVANGRVAGLGVNGGADIEFNHGRVTVNRFHLEQGQGVLTASGVIGGDQELGFALTAERFDVATLASVLRLPYSVGGGADLKGRLSGRLDNPILDLGFTVRGGSIENIAVDELTGNLAYKGGVLTLSDGAIRRGGRAAEASGSIPVPTSVLRSFGLMDVEGADPGEHMDLSLKMPRGDLSLASLIDPALSVPSGVGSLELRLGGTWQKPLVDGQVRIEDAVVRYKGVPGEATAVNATIDFNGQKVLIKNLSARYMGGTVGLRGSAELGAPWIQAMDLTATASGVHYQAPFLDTGIDGSISIKGSLPAPSIRGQVTLNRMETDFGKWPGGFDALSGLGGWVTDGRVPGTANMGFAGVAGVAGVAGSGGGVAHKGGGGGPLARFDPTFDVLVEPKGDFHLVGAGLVDVYGNGEVSLRGSLSRPSLSGRLDVTRGTLNYLDTPFTITDGRAEFATYRGLIPYLVVTAETTVSDTRIRLYLSGPADRLTQTLASDPPLAEDQIMALLGLPGRVSRFAEGDARSALQSEMLQLFDQQVSGRLLSSLEQKVKDVLQLDEFRIRAGVSLDSFSVQLGKYLFDNLYVSYSRTFTQKPYESFRLELRLTPSVLLSGGLDNTGDFRLGIETKFRF